jgi:hypothetical protein
MLVLFVTMAHARCPPAGNAGRLIVSNACVQMDVLTTVAGYPNVAPETRVHHVLLLLVPQQQIFLMVNVVR